MGLFILKYHNFKKMSQCCHVTFQTISLHSKKVEQSRGKHEIQLPMAFTFTSSVARLLAYTDLIAPARKTKFVKLCMLL